MRIDPLQLLKKYCDAAQFEMLSTHGRSVAKLALAIGKQAGIEDGQLLFIEEAALLHDIGVCRVVTSETGLQGGYPYIMHGIIGREILEREGLPRHALVCERHIGVGLTVSDIVSQGLPLPWRDMAPRNIEEQIICCADLFFSKKPGKLTTMKSPEKVRTSLLKFGDDKLEIFDQWMNKFHIMQLVDVF